MYLSIVYMEKGNSLGLKATFDIKGPSQTRTKNVQTLGCHQLLFVPQAVPTGMSSWLWGEGTCPRGESRSALVGSGGQCVPMTLGMAVMLKSSAGNSTSQRMPVSH